MIYPTEVEFPIQFIQKRARLTNFRARIAASGVKLIKNPYVVMCIVETAPTGSTEHVYLPTEGHIQMTLEKANKTVRTLRKIYPKNIYYKAKLERCMK